MIRIVIAEDQSLLRGALVTLLGLEPDIEIIGQATNGDEALRQTESLTPDVLVTDIEMPGLTGIELAAQVQRKVPTTRVLIVTTFDRPGYLKRAMQAGVMGYVLKDTPSDALADAIRTVASGGRAVAPDLAATAWSATDPLSDRERQMLRLAEAGKSNRDIGSELNLSAGTVRNYLATASEKLGASNRIEAFTRARAKGWL